DQTSMQIERSVFFQPADASVYRFSTRQPHQLTLPGRKEQLSRLGLRVLVAAEECSDISTQFFWKGRIGFSSLKLLESKVNRKISFAGAKGCRDRFRPLKSFEKPEGSCE